MITIFAPFLVFFLVAESFIIYKNYDRYIQILPSMTNISMELSVDHLRGLSKLSGLKQDFIHGYYEIKHSKKRIYIKSTHHWAFVSLFIGFVSYSKKGDILKIDYIVKLRIAPLIFFLAIVGGLTISLFAGSLFDDHFFLNNYFVFFPLIIVFLIYMYYDEFNKMKSSFFYVIEELKLTILTQK